MQFYKYHGLGNDFVFIEDIKQQFANQYSQLALSLCDRHFGIGADGLVIINQEPDQMYRMRIFNADGSEPEMCGNAIRCVGKYLYERGLVTDSSLTVHTKAGKMVLDLTLQDGEVTLVRVNMGQACWLSKAIPVISDMGEVITDEFNINGKEFLLSCVSMGNPHAVCVLAAEQYENFDLSYWGPLIEKHHRFPECTNVEFVQIISKDEIAVKVWERGVGKTLACGTGACASVAVTHRLGLTNDRVLVQLPGGELSIEVADKWLIYMTGPATKVFTGQL